MPPTRKLKSRPNRSRSRNRAAPTVKPLLFSSAETLIYKDVSFRFVKTPSFHYIPGPLRSVVLDNDEATGVFAKLRELLNTYDNAEDYNSFITHATRELLQADDGMPSFRPGIERFLRFLHDLKMSNRIDAVIMYTNMTVKPLFKGTNSNILYTRPEILSDIFDKILGNSGNAPLIDLIIFRDTSYPPYKYFSVIEKIYNVEGNGNKYVFLDDKPENILNTGNSTEPSAQAFGITEYKGRPTNKSFNNSYSAKGVEETTVYELLNKVFP